MSNQPPANQPPPGQWGPPPQGPPPGPPPQGPPGQWGSPPPPGPYGPSQPPYGPPGGPPPTRGRSKGPVIAIVVAALIVVGGGITAALLLLGGDDEASTSSPEDTVDSFAQALRDGDCDTVMNLFTDRFAEGAGECKPEELKEQSAVDFGDAEITEESDDSAVAKVVDDNVTYELHLVNQDGAWLIDEVGASASSEAPDARPDD